MVFVANHEPSEVLQPGKKSFDFPASLVAPKLAAVLAQVPSVFPVWRNELDAAFFKQLLVEGHHLATVEDTILQLANWNANKDCQTAVSLSW